MNKLRFGTKEVVAVIAATIIYVLVEAFERYLIGQGLLAEPVLDWVRIRVLMVIVVAAMFGPIVGVVCGVGGALLVNVIFYGYISYSEVVTYALSGYLVGRYYDKLGVLNGEFKGIALVDFNAIQILTHIVCSILFLPLFLFATENELLGTTIVLGVKNAIGAIIETCVLGTPILYIVSKSLKKSHRTIKKV